MPYKEVISYYLTYEDRPIVWVRVEGDPVSHPIAPAPNDAVFVADMLRNEKPVYYLEERNMLSTSAEIVGEEET